MTLNRIKDIFKENCDITLENDNEKLFSIIDSFQFINLVAEIESTFDITLTQEDLLKASKMTVVEFLKSIGEKVNG